MGTSMAWVPVECQPLRGSGHTIPSLFSPSVSSRRLECLSGDGFA